MVKQTFSRWQILIFSLNFLIGYAFIIGMGSTYLTAGMIGFPIVMVFCALIAYMVGMAFARLAAKYPAYGGSYVYMKKVAEHSRNKKRMRFFAYFVGWSQYIQAPFVGVTIISGIVWAFKNANFFGWNLDPAAFHVAEPYLFIIAGVIFGLVVIAVNLGFNSTKWTLNIMWAVKWVVIVGAMGIAGYVIGKDIISGQFQTFINNLSGGTGTGSHYDLFPKGFKGFIAAIFTFFFSFGGIEGIATISNDIENPSQNIRKIISTTILITLAFYFVFCFLVLGAVGGETQNGLFPPDGSGGHDASANPLNSLIVQILGSSGGVAFAILSGIGIMSQISNQASARVSNTWINTRMLLPLAVDGYLPRSFAFVNKHTQFQRCLYLDSIVTIILIIPYIILGFFNSNIQDNLQNTLSIYTLVIFCQYLGTVYAALALEKFKQLNFYQYEKMFKLSKNKSLAVKLPLERWMYYFGFTMLTFFLVSFFIQGIQYGAESHWSISDPGSGFFNFVFQVILYVIAVLLGMGLYGVAKWRRWNETPFPKSYLEYVKLHGETNEVIDLNEHLIAMNFRPLTTFN